jgi:hypothetical protein
MPLLIGPLQLSILYLPLVTKHTSLQLQYYCDTVGPEPRFMESKCQRIASPNNDHSIGNVPWHHKPLGCAHIVLPSKRGGQGEGCCHRQDHEVQGMMVEWLLVKTLRTPC